MDVTHEDIDTAEIEEGGEEEEWVEYLKKEARKKLKKNESSQCPLLDRNSKKNEMEIGNEDRFTP